MMWDEKREIGDFIVECCHYKPVCGGIAMTFKMLGLTQQSV